MWSTFIKQELVDDERARRLQRHQVSVAKGAVLDQRHRQLSLGDLGGHQIEPVAADDDDAAGARGAREPHGVDEQRLATDGDERLGDMLGQRAEAAPEARRQQHRLHASRLY